MRDMLGSHYDADRNIRSEPGQTQRAALGLRFANGTTCWLKSDSLSEYLLAPIFLKFLAISIAIIVILQDRSHQNEFLGLTLIFHMVAVTGGTLVCLFCLGAVCISLKNVGAIRAIYTPLICLPSLLLTEYIAQEALLVIWGVPRMSMETALIDVSRMCGVVILLDILYGSFVAPVHPQTLRIAPDTGGGRQPREGTGPVAATAGPTIRDDAGMPPTFQEPTEATVAPNMIRSAPKIRIRENNRPTILMQPSILIGAERVPIDSLIMIGAEDHYLRVVTLQGNKMIRGKLATVIEKLDPDLGVQANRSIWVARSQVSHAQLEDSRRLSLCLRNGTEVVVARPRLTLVKDCIRRWNIEMRNGAVAEAPSGLVPMDLDQAS